MRTQTEQTQTERAKKGRKEFSSYYYLEYCRVKQKLEDLEKEKRQQEEQERKKIQSVFDTMSREEVLQHLKSFSLFNGIQDKRLQKLLEERRKIDYEIAKIFVEKTSMNKIAFLFGYNTMKAIDKVFQKMFSFLKNKLHKQKNQKIVITKADADSQSQVLEPLKSLNISNHSKILASSVLKAVPQNPMLAKLQSKEASEKEAKIDSIVLKHIDGIKTIQKTFKPTLSLSV